MAYITPQKRIKNRLKEIRKSTEPGFCWLCQEVKEGFVMFKYAWLRAWWWTATFCLSMGVIYGQAMKKRNASLREASFRLSEVEQETLVALEEKENLALRLASQSDPAWIELVLLRQMGVVPEGFLKVHFKR